MRMKKLLSLSLCLLMLFTLSAAEESTLLPLPMDQVSAGPAPQDANYISDTEYVDESISVKIYEGRYADTDYMYAHVKISHPSQLRTAPAAIGNSQNVNFKNSSSTRRGWQVAEAANAVIAINGDYYTQTACEVVLRMGTQVRNKADGLRDLLIVDKNGDFSYLATPMKSEYAAYYEAHKEEMYQVFCFGPVMVENGVNLIPADYKNGYIGAQKEAQRAAICQLGPLEYMIVTSYGNQTKGNKGMTIPEFAVVCDTLGWELNPEGGCKLAYNLDGGNSTTMVFKRLDAQSGKLKHMKINCPEIERFLSDIIYFATLVR